MFSLTDKYGRKENDKSRKKTKMVAESLFSLKKQIKCEKLSLLKIKRQTALLKLLQDVDQYNKKNKKVIFFLY